MSTGMSVKRNVSNVVHSESKVGGTGLAVFGLLAGIVVFILGAVFNFNPALFVGFLSLTTSFLYLNANFWASVYSKHEPRMPSESRILRM